MNNQCENCGNYQKHYAKTKAGFIYINCGRCLKRKCGETKENCNYYCIRNDEEIENYYFKNSVYEIKKRLESIEGFLKNH